MMDLALASEKIKEVREEMQRNGLWASEAPAWVTDYEKRSISTSGDFIEWLQFIYLPNLKAETGGKKPGYKKDYIAPQAVKFFGGDIKKGKLLQLLIELDSLS